MDDLRFEMERLLGMGVDLIRHADWRIKLMLEVIDNHLDELIDFTNHIMSCFADDFAS